MKYLYTPATESAWTAIAGPQQLIVVDSPHADVVEKLWAQQADGVHSAMETLSSLGLSKTPSFALVEFASAVSGASSARVIVRGPVTVTVTTSTGEVSLSGATVSTWAEQQFDEVVTCGVRAGDSVSASSLPLAAGVVLTSEVQCSISGDEPMQAAATSADSASSAAAGGSAASLESAAVASTPKTISEATISGPTSAMVDLPPVASPSSPVEARGDGSLADGPSSVPDETVFREVADEPEHVEPVDSQAPGSATLSGLPQAQGDHDGMTIMSSDVQNLRKQRASSAPVPPPPPPPAGPSLFLQLSTGSKELLSQPIQIGRAPTATKVSSGALPRLVTIPGDKDISRNHVHIAVEGGTVVVTDLHSRNGTVIVLPGKSPQRLRAGEPTAVIVGTIVDLGGDVTLTVGEQL